MTPGAQAFPIVSRPRGDDGRMAPHLEITCSDCGNQDYAVIARGVSPPPAMTNGLFRKRGWNVGHRRSNDLCPICNPRFGKAKAHAGAIVQEETPVSAPSTPKPIVEALVSPTLRADPPPQPSRADRRRIQDALDGVYELDVGYTGANTDTSLACTLDVPRAWVSMIREDYFGPDSNAAVITIRADLEKLISQGRSLEDRGMVLAAEGETLRREAERLAQTLSQAR